MTNYSLAESSIGVFEFEKIVNKVEDLNSEQEKQSDKIQEMVDAFKAHTHEDQLAFINLNSEVKFIQKLLWFILSIVGFCAGGIGGQILLHYFSK